MQRYFANIVDKKVLLSKDDSFHLLKVMRAGVGDQIEVVSDGCVYICEMTSKNPLQIEVLRKCEEDNELDFKLILVISLLKGEKMDFVIQKATEIGVSEIILVRSEHCISKIKPDEVTNKLARFTKIAKEASEQSKRSKVPLITKVIDFRQISCLNFDHKMIGTVTNNKSKGFLQEIRKIQSKESAAILIGPEGGWTNEEEDVAIRNGWQAVSFGKRVLRAETAAIASLSIISSVHEGK